MWIALLALMILVGAAGIVMRSAREKASGNPADAFDIVEDM